MVSASLDYETDLCYSKSMRQLTWTPQQLIESVRTSFTIADVLKKLGLKVRPGNYRTLHKYIIKLGISTKHFKGSAHGTTIPTHKRDSKDVFRKNSFYNSADLAPRLIKEKLKKNRCAICKRPPRWRGKYLRLVADHINGDHLDNRLKNLRLLCPNCNSQTDTFCR